MPRGVPTKPLHFRADGSLQRRLAFIAAERGVTISELAREYSDRYAREYFKDAGETSPQAIEGAR